MSSSLFTQNCVYSFAGYIKKEIPIKIQQPKQFASKKIYYARNKLCSKLNTIMLILYNFMLKVFLCSLCIVMMLKLIPPSTLNYFLILVLVTNLSKYKHHVSLKNSISWNVRYIANIQETHVFEQPLSLQPKAKSN